MNKYQTLMWLPSAKSTPALIIMLVMSLLSSCSGEDKEAIAMKYNQNYDYVFTYCADIEQVAKSLHVNSSDLVKMRYGVIEPSAEATDILAELAENGREQDYGKVTEILDGYFEDAPDLKIQAESKPVSVSDLYTKYRNEVFVRNEAFDSEFPSHISSSVVYMVEEYLDKEFAWYRFPVNAWDYVVDGKSELESRYLNGFNNILSVENINDRIATRVFNNYSRLLDAEYKTLFNTELAQPMLKKLDLDGTDAIISKAVTGNMVGRAATDLTDVLITLVEEVVVATIIWIVFGMISRYIVNWYGENVLDLDLGRGWKYNILAGALNFLNYWSMNEELERINNIKKWVNRIATVAFLVITYFYVIKPQMKLESEIITTMETNITEYASKIDAPILSYFNGVIDSVEL